MGKVFYFLILKMFLEFLLEFLTNTINNEFKFCLYFFIIGTTYVWISSDQREILSLKTLIEEGRLLDIMLNYKTTLVLDISWNNWDDEITVKVIELIIG
jgi:hypothetical protein